MEDKKPEGNQSGSHEEMAPPKEEVKEEKKPSIINKRKRPVGFHLKLKRRKIREAGAPKMPLTGYVRYMKDRREQLLNEFPNKSAIEHTKMIGEEWNHLSEEIKAPYLAAAEVDRQRYLTELDAFLRDRPDILEMELAKNKSQSSKKTSNTNGTKSVLTEKSQLNGDSKDIPVKSKQPTSSVRRSGENGIPIFTDEFLEHNKTADMELRTLRKSTTDFEQQNSVLEKHIENMKFGVEKIENENNELQEKNRLLEAYLDKLRLKLAQALSGLSIPSEPHGATLDNIDKYMKDLYSMATSNSHGPASLNKAKDIIRKLDLHIQL